MHRARLTRATGIFIVERPWGNFQQFVSNEQVTVKIITVEPGHRLSLQTHDHRGEFWQVLDVPIEVTVGDRTWSAQPGEAVWVPWHACTAWPTRASSRGGCSRSRSATSTRPTSCASRTTTPADRRAVAGLEVCAAPRRSQATVSSPSRHRPGRRAAASRRRAAAAAVARNRCRTPKLAWCGGVRPGPVERHRARRARARPATLRWIRALGSRSAMSEGAVSPRSRHDSVSDTRPGAVDRDPGAAAARARHRCRRRAARRGASRSWTVAQAAATSDSSYCRSTLKARTTVACRARVQRHLETAQPERQSPPAPGLRPARPARGRSRSRPPRRPAAPGGAGRAARRR